MVNKIHLKMPCSWAFIWHLYDFQSARGGDGRGTDGWSQRGNVLHSRTERKGSERAAKTADKPVFRHQAPRGTTSAAARDNAL